MDHFNWMSLEATNGRHFLSMMWHNVATTILYYRNPSHVCVDSPSAERITVQNMHIYVQLEYFWIIPKTLARSPKANRPKWKLPNGSRTS
jgi:hypothetical protein